MPVKLRLKNSSVASAVPLVTDLALGELAINTFDGKIFLKKNDGVDSIVDLSLINIGNTTINETINISTGNGIKTLTIGSTNTTSSTTIQSGTNRLNIEPQTTAILNISTLSHSGNINFGTSISTQNINIGTNTGNKSIIIGGTGANNISIGNTQTGGSILIGNALTTGTLNIGSGAATATIGIGIGAGTQTINLGTGAARKNITIGSQTATSITSVRAGTGGISIQPIGTGVVNISTISQTGAITIGTGTGAQSIFIGTGAAVKALTIGSTNTTSATTIQSGTGLITLATAARISSTLQVGGTPVGLIGVRFSGAYSTGFTGLFGYLTTGGAGTFNGATGTVNWSAEFDNRVRFNGEINVFSDRRAKKHIDNLSTAKCLQAVLDVPSVLYSWDDGREDVSPKLGFYSQDVEDAGIHEAIVSVYNKLPNGIELDDFKFLDKNMMLSVLWSAVQELNKKIDKLANK